MLKSFRHHFRSIILLTLALALSCSCVACAGSDEPERSEYVTAESYGGDVSFAFAEEATLDGVSARKDMTVVIDAGHGDRDPGVLTVTSSGQEIRESDVNLELALRLAYLLREMGYDVLMIREDDSSLLGADDPDYSTDKEADERRKKALAEAADLYISLHCNSAGDTDARGTRIFYNGRVVVSFEGRTIAHEYKDALNSVFEDDIEQNRVFAVKNNHLNGMSEPYIVLKDTKMPAFLFEVGFVTNESDLSLLTDGDFLWEYAYALALATDEARVKGLI